VTVRRGARWRPDTTFIIICGVTLAIVLVTAALPVSRMRILAPSLDLALDSVALVITCMIAILSWAQYRDRRDVLSLHEAAAFLVLAAAGIQSIAVSLGPDVRQPLASEEPGSAELFALTVVRGVAAALFAIGGIAALRGWRGLPPPVLMTAPLVPTAAVLIVALTGGDSLPPLIVAGPAGHPVSTPLGLVLQAAIGCTFLVAAFASRRVWRRNGLVGDHYLSLGLVLMAGAQFSDAVAPNTHPGPVATGDILRIACGLVLILAIEAQARDLLATQRRSNAELARLRVSETARAALEERARLSRDLHDGLTQDLWLAKMKAASLKDAELDPAARTTVAELTEALDQGLAEARQVVLSLRLSEDVDGGFAELLTQVVDDTSDRFGLRVELAMPSAVPPLRARTQAELIRIVQEALTNARRHARANRVAIRTYTSGERFCIEIADNGCGFDASDVRPGAVGLRSMRERAAIIGATLEIRPGEPQGTCVTVAAPLASPVAS